MTDRGRTLTAEKIDDKTKEVIAKLERQTVRLEQAVAELRSALGQIGDHGES